jgi:hypothetical protein
MKRETHLVLGMVLVMAAIGVIVLLPGRVGAPIASPSPAVNQPPPAAVTFTEIAHGSKSTVAKRVNYLIASAEDMKKLWNMVDAKGAVPTVDFTKDDIIAVFAGEEPTTGYTIEVSTIEDSTERMVKVTLGAPGGNCVTGQSITHPYQIIRVPITNLPLTHKDVSVTNDCEN